MSSDKPVVPEEVDKNAKRILRNVIQRLPPDTAVIIVCCPFDPKGEKPDDWVFYFSNIKEREMALKLLSRIIEEEGH